MYESYETLKIKEKAGISSAIQELQFRKKHKESLPLQGLKNTKLYLVQTKEIQMHLEMIEQLYEKVNCEHKVKDIILLDAFHSATIEGARTTVENVRKSYEKPKSKDDKMVVNTIHGMQYAYENPITMDNIRELWEIVTKDVCEQEHLAGTRFRSGMVYVGSNTDIIHTPAEAEHIEDMMQDWFKFASSSNYNAWLTAAILHFYFVYTHPFCDDHVIIRTKLEKPSKINGLALI
ncbi:MAG: Fic family protein [Lachnospiraceae bacterium]|nr:Fic family protein [Lachnospiraceae bacterium]